jgi:exosortase/archaeosortase
LEGEARQIIGQGAPRASGHVEPFPRLTTGLIIRIGLCAALVFLCHQFEWRLLRLLTAECILRMSNWLGIAMSRMSFDIIGWAGTQFQFVVACTQIDVFCGAVPLIWNLKIPVWRNLAKLATFFCCLFLFNVMRLELGFVLFAHGLSWFWGHEFVGGVALFVIFLWVLGQLRLVSSMREQGDIKYSPVPAT